MNTAILVALLIIAVLFAVVCGIGWRFAHTALVEALSLDTWEQYREVQRAARMEGFIK